LNGKEDISRRRKCTEDTTVPTICFYQAGEFWRIGEIGKEQPFKNTKGFEFIHYLLRYPLEHIESKIVYDCGEGPVDENNDEDGESINSGNGSKSMKELREEGLHLKGKSYDPEIDATACAAYEVQKVKLQTELNLPGLTPERKCEIEKEIKWLSAALAKKGRKTRTKTSESIRTSITKRIKEALKKIYLDKSVAYINRYLNDRTIKRGDSCIYQPDPNDKPRWILFKNQLPS